jgi:tripartite-type tricarboxylate transporter receptor subunit TctC
MPLSGEANMTNDINRDRRSILSAALGSTLFSLGTSSWAQTGKIIKFIVGVPPGGGMDATARLVAENVREELGTVIVDNKPGAALRIAVQYVKEAPNDGSTLLYTSTSAFTIYPHVYKRLGYNVETDFVPVAPTVAYDFALGVPGDSPVSTLGQYIEAVKQNPTGMGTYAVPASGSSLHFVGAAFATAAGVELKHVPYKGSAPAMQDLIGGHVPACVNVLGEFLPSRSTGKVRILAMTGARRSPLAPDVPTFAELGFKALVLNEQFGLFAPARTPLDTVARINQSVTAAIQRQEVQRRLYEMGYASAPMSAAVFADKLRQDRAVWGALVKATGFSLEE